MGTEIEKSAKVMKTKNIVFKVFIILSIGWVILVFALSNQTKRTSESLSMKVTNLVIKMMPEERQIEYEESYTKTMGLNVLIRKITHFMLYLSGGVVITMFVTMSKMSMFKIVCVSTVFGVLYACTDEMHQLFIQGRGAEVRDVLIDGMGFIFGEIIVIMICIRKKKKLEKSDVNE